MYVNPYFHTVGTRDYYISQSCQDNPFATLLDSIVYRTIEYRYGLQ